MIKNYRNSILLFIFMFFNVASIKLAEQEKCNNNKRWYCSSDAQAAAVDKKLLTLKEEGFKITYERIKYYAEQYAYLKDSEPSN